MRILLILIIMPFSLFGQVNIDSLWDVWNDPNQADTNRVKAIHDIGWNGYLFSQPDSAFIIGQMEYDFAMEHDISHHMIMAMTMQGVSFAIRGNNEKALEYFQKCYDLSEEFGDKQRMAEAVNNIGVLYKRQGDFKLAIDNFYKAYKVQIELGNKSAMATSLNNIAVIYSKQGNLLKSIEYHSESLKISEEIKDKNGMAGSYFNIGNLKADIGNYSEALIDSKKAIEIYQELNDDFKEAMVWGNTGNYYAKLGQQEKSMECILKSLEIRERVGDQNGISSSLNNLGMLQFESNMYDEALKSFRKSFEIRKELKLKDGIIESLSNIGKVLYAQGKYRESLDYNKRAYDLAIEIDGLKEIRSATEDLWKTYKKLGQYDKALKIYELHNKANDSILTEDNQNAVIRQEYQYQYEKQAAADSVKAAEEAKVKDAELAAEHAENVRRKQQSYFLYGGLALALVFGGFIFNRYKVTRQQKEIISEQKEEVDKAYVELEDKNQKILDSITYAKRIQSAILPPTKVVKEYLHDSFIIYLPKDVVAGDFYWLEAFAKASASEGSVTEASASEGTKILFAAADCTGHGVPGAMVSVVCNNGLNRSVREHGLTDPGKILDKTREIVVKEFEKSEEEVKDGMDIALCVLDGNTLEYAGAHNPLVIVRKDTEECEVIKPNKQPIGQFDNPQPYTTHKLELNEGDSIYLFSDGFQDQFGGPKGKKFMISRFKKLLVEVSKEPMNKQRDMILKAFNDWKGNEEQVDDVCVIGVKV